MNKNTKLKILLFGGDKIGVDINKPNLEEKDFVIEFEYSKTQKSLHEYDIVIIIQSLFEEPKLKKDQWDDVYNVMECDRNELDKRKKELLLHLKNGGIVCFLLHDKIVDRIDNFKCEDTDLIKFLLNNYQIQRNNFQQRITTLNCIRDEFINFIDISGASYTYFNTSNQDIEIKPIVKFGKYICGFILERQIFVIPTLPIEDKFNDYIILLTESIILTKNKLFYELPRWIDEFQFEQEKLLYKKKNDLNDKLNDINSTLERLNLLKRILVDTSENLVTSVNSLLRDYFGFITDDNDLLKEDLKMLNDKDEVIALVEVKSSNGNLKREYVNQADSFRERSDFDSDFPVILIINTFIKSSKKINDKDKELPPEQVKHACNMNILVLRTIDLLRLVQLYFNKKLKSEEILELFVSNNGWLKVENDAYTIER